MPRIAKMLTFATVIFLSLGSLCACGGKDIGADPLFLFKQANRVEVEIGYEPGAEPYTGNVQGLETWSILKQNLNILFQSRSTPIAIYVPDQLSLMSTFPTQDKRTWNTQELFDLEKQTRKLYSEGNVARVYFMFVRGVFVNKEGQLRPQVLGVTLPQSSTIAIFKDAIRQGAPYYQEISLRWLEQSTLVHEWGHVAGLVNNGIPRISNSGENIDEEHTGHCGNPKCVMYWAHEGLSSLMILAYTARTLGQMSLFGDECLNDLKAF